MAAKAAHRFLLLFRLRVVSLCRIVALGRTLSLGRLLHLCERRSATIGSSPSGGEKGIVECTRLLLSVLCRARLCAGGFLLLLLLQPRPSTTRPLSYFEHRPFAAVIPMMGVSHQSTQGLVCVRADTRGMDLVREELLDFSSDALMVKIRT